MPKIKKTNDENASPKVKGSPKVRRTKNPKKQPFKFDIKQILKERQADNAFWTQSAQLDKEIKIVDDLFQEEVTKSAALLEETQNNNKLPARGLAIFDRSKFNHINLNYDQVETHSQKLLELSVEQNELEATIQYNYLLKANWSPTMEDFQNIFFNWGADLQSLLYKPTSKSPINEYEKIGRHNFELVMDFMARSILNNNHNLTNEELITLAKYTISISSDYYCGQMINVIKKMFGACIEAALHEDDKTAIIAFAQEVYSSHSKSDLLKLIVDLFLPLEGRSLKNIYSYLTFKLYKQLLERTNINVFPTSVDDWFVQDMINKDFFNLHPKKLLSYVVHLLEHVVIVFDLYQNEEKLSLMYDFLSAAARPSGLSESLKIVNILDQWRLRLFRLYVNRKNII